MIRFLSSSNDLVTTFDHTATVQLSPAAPDAAVGVCYLTASAEAGGDISELVVRLVITSDVTTPHVTVRHVRGYDEACALVRSWMSTMCESGRRP